jgi:signal peptidase I
MTSKIKQTIKKTWKFLWESDSALSWILNIIIAFVLVKFIIYPGLGLFLGTTHPVVAVVSGSMSHDLENGNICGYSPSNYESNFDGYWKVCGKWYENNNINKETANTWKFRNGFNKGDIMILMGVKPKDINVGDVIVFKSPLLSDPIIHRAVKKSLNNTIVFQTKGDHNNDSINQHGEYNVDQSRIIGKAVLRVPYLGWIKILAVDMVQYVGRLFGV